MSELLLYILATAVVLAGVAYFFVKQREQEALANKSASQSRATNKKAKKEKVKKEPKEPREPRQRKVKKEEPEPVVSSKKKGKEEDETKNVLEFLKNKRVTSEKTEKTAQAKVKSAPPPKPQSKAPAPAAVFYSDDSESDDDTEGYDTIKRKIKSVKEKGAETVGQSDNQQQTKKNKFFTKQEAEDHKNAGLQRKKEREARQAEREAFKALPAAERNRLRKIAEKARAEEAGFEAPKSRPRRERNGEGEAEEENEDGTKRSKYPPREADTAPVFASEYETADMDNILNNLTSYYNANPQAGRGNGRRNRPVADKHEEESGKSEETDE